MYSVADKPGGKKKLRTKRKNNGAKVPIARRKEDLENKGKKKLRSVEPRPAKKKVLEDANNSKLRRLVEVRVEDCLRRVSKELSVSVSAEPVSVPQEAKEDCEGEEDGEKSAAQPETVSTEPEVVADDEARMDDGPTAAALRFPDDRSDSGVSSLRSGSGDERSGSRSSALSGTDEPQVRHVHSVQHQTLLMSHGTPGQAPPPAAPAAAYPPPPPLMHPLHHLPPQPTHLYPQHVAVADMLWKPRYHHPSAPPHIHPDDMLERERAMAQDRDRQERLFRYDDQSFVFIQ